MIWKIDPSEQDLDQISSPPGIDRSAIIIEPYSTWDGIRSRATSSTLNSFQELAAPTFINIEGLPSTQFVRLSWSYVMGSSGYRIYLSLIHNSEPTRP